MDRTPTASPSEASAPVSPPASPDGAPTATPATALPPEPADVETEAGAVVRAAAPQTGAPPAVAPQTGAPPAAAPQTVEPSPELPVDLLVRRHPPRLTPRLFAALVAARAAGASSRVMGRGGGTSLPGMVARRVDPDVLGTIVAARNVPVVAITGSNGKTTTARFTAAILRREGITVAHNSSGSNLVQGVTSLAVGSADLRGGLPSGALVAEVDEGALLVVADELRPRALVIVDLFRDQLDRFGELHALGEALDTVASRLPPDRALVVNADDPLVASLAAGRNGRRVTFGFDVGVSLDRITRAADTIRCPRCRSTLTYRTVHLSHMGDWSCEGCGFARPDLDVAVTSVDVTGLGETRCTVRLPDDSTLDLAIPQAGIHVAYDAVAAIATVIALDVPVVRAAEALAGIRPAFGRIESVPMPDGRSIVLAFSKNPTSFNTTFRALASEGEPRHLLIAVSNTLVDGEDFAWLWDVDVESVASRIEDAVISGTRADELATRLKYAGVDPARMTVVEDRVAALDAGLANVPAGDRLTVVAGYTPTIEIREEMHRRGWTGRFWEQ